MPFLPTLMPKHRVEREMTADRPKVGFVTSYQRRPDATRRERDQDVEAEVPKLGGVVTLAVLDPRQDLGRVGPVPFRRGHNPAMPLEITDEPTLHRRSGSAEEFVEDDGRTTRDEGRLEDPARETACPEILDVDGGVEYGKPSLP